MGGKRKVANRTKNNARPSNSGRSAELLGSSMPQFVGFSGIKDKGFAGFSLAPVDELELSVDPNVQLVLKKIKKKDSTTRIKGLQEFAELVKNLDQETIKPILPIWPRLYTILATDIDNRVREATHNVHHQIILKAKRNIAPYLKQLMAPWFTSQYDTYPPAASVASQAFKDAFPTNKFQEAVIYCQEEILSYLKDNLLVQTAQTLSNPKHVCAEDAEAKYERVLNSCLQGYYLYLQQVPTVQIQNMEALNNDILSNTKFWKLGKHKVAHIRAAWFKLMTVICQKAAFLLEGKGAQITSAVFGSLEESEPVVLVYVWEAVLLIMTSIKDWWTFINIDKLFFPKLWKILKHGGYGNAAVIYPNLLPLISRLPASMDESSSQFHNTFFENFILGLKQKTVVASRSESVAVITAFVECFQYTVLKKQAEVQLCKMLIKNYIITTIEWCLVEDQISYKIIFNQIASLVQYWNRNATQSEELRTYLQFFFEHITDLFKETLFNLKEIKTYNVDNISSKQIQFLQSLKQTSKPKKLLKVKFVNEDSESMETSPDNSTVTSSEYDSAYYERLNYLVYNISENYVKFIEEKQSKDLFEHLCSLIVDFDANHFFINLNEKMKKKNPNSQLIDIFNNLLYKWLQSADMCCKHIVDLIFLLFPYLNKEDKKLILTKLLEVPSEECLGWCISEALAHPHNTNPLVQNWLKSDKIGDFLIAIAEKQINDECTPELNVLFKLALTENENGELLIQEDCINAIIDKLVTTLENYSSYSNTVDTCASLAAYISAIIYTDSLLLSYSDKLLLALFTLSCNSSIDNDIISVETIYEINSAWQDAVTLLTKHLNKEENNRLTSKFADVLESEFINGNLEESQLDHLTNVSVNFLRAVYKSAPLSLSDFLVLFLERSFIPPWRYDVTQLCMIAEYVTGNLSSPFEEITGFTSGIEEFNIAKYFAWTYLKLAIVATNLVEELELDEDEEEADVVNSRAVIILNVTDNREEFISQILYDLSVGQSYLENFTNAKHYDLVLHYHVLTEMKIKAAVENLDDPCKSNLRRILKEKAINEAWFWCKATYILYSTILQEPLANVYKEFVESITAGDHLGFLHLTQLFRKHLDYEDVQKKFNTVGKVIILNSLIHCDEIDVQIAEVFGKIEAFRSENVPQFLYDTSNISWQKTQEITEIVRLCSSLMKHKFTSLSRRHWDFGVLSLVSWASNCLKIRSSYEKYQFQAFLCAVVKLYLNVDKQMKQMKEEGIKSSYIDEWEDVLLESIHGDLAQLWLYIAEQLELKQWNVITYLPLIQEFGVVVENIYYKFIFKINDTSLPKWTKFLKRSCSLLVNPQPNMQLWGYKMLLILAPGLIKIDTEVVNMDTPHKKGLIFEQFKEKLMETHEIVDSMLVAFKLGEDSCRVEPSTDSSIYTFAYLLLWDVLLTLCDRASTELRYQYADWLRNEDLLKKFLNNLFRLMPMEVLQYSEGKSKSLIDLFLKKPVMYVKDTCNSEKIEHLVCWLHASTLTQLPALVRQWWMSLETKTAQVVEKVTSVYVSSQLCIQELNEVVKHQTQFKNMIIKVIPNVRQIVAVYTVDEAQVELVITLPANYPLGGFDIQCNKQICGTNHKQWLLQFKKCVLHQNGRIWDGLSLWNNNLDKKFDGVEECYICFAVLHSGTYQLPKLSCHTCRKKFHSACLYQWFKTSYKGSCPICRNLF